MKPERTENKPELLAPAGSFDAALAAIQHGADAVYLGLKEFSARAGAENLTIEQCSRIVGYAHSFTPQRRIYVTVNTLLQENELSHLIKLLNQLAVIGIDAVIVQDLGVCRIVQKYFPGLELHASTQMAVHNRAGVLALREIGFSRVILARELTLDEISDISAVEGIQTEVFAHGALCYGYSGLCLLSSHLHGSSGNRGECAYVCRDKFTLSDAGEESPALPEGPLFPFSMKDLALENTVETLENAKVKAFKIEGRMKSPLYTAIVTDYYRKILDGTMDQHEQEQTASDLRTVFSRPWTNLYIQSRQQHRVTDTDAVGNRGARLGTTIGIVPGNSAKGDMLRFSVEQRPLERYDGIQLELPGRRYGYGFAAEQIYAVASSPGDRNRTVFASGVGSVVDVPLPSEHPPIPSGIPVNCTSSQAVKEKYGWTTPRESECRLRFDVDFEISLTHKNVHIHARTVTPGLGPIFVDYDHPMDQPLAPARKLGAANAAVEKAFGRLGDTDFQLHNLELRNPEELFVPSSKLNHIRRNIAELLGEKLQSDVQAREADILKVEIADRFPRESDTKHEFDWSIATNQPACLAAFEPEDWANLDEITIDVDKIPLDQLQESLARISEKIGSRRVRLGLPAITRADEETDLKDKIRALIEDDWERWSVSNPGAWHLLGLISGADSAAPGIDQPIDIITDWPLYVLNHAAVEALADLHVSAFTLSPEDDMANMELLLRRHADKACVIVYQDTPLCVSDSCAFFSVTGECPGKERCRFRQMEVTSDKGSRLFVINSNCRTYILNRSAFCLSDKLETLRQIGARRIRADFRVRRYTPETALEIWRKLRNGDPIENTHCANFERGL